MAPAAFKSFNHVFLIMLLIFPFSTTLSKSVGESENEMLLQQRKKILGSRPPACVNKCSSCRPCMATLVIPPHHKMATTTSNLKKNVFKYSSDEDDTYYLLSWKCKCGNKVYQP